MEADLPGNLSRLAAAALDRIEGITDDYMSRLAEEQPEWSAAMPEMQGAFRAMARDSMATELATLRDGGAPPDRPPEIDVEFARGGARLGAPPHLLGDAYRRGHAAQWETVFRLAEEREPDPEARRLLLKRASDFFFSYASRLSRLTIEEYTEERDRMLRDREQRRVHLVRELLDGNMVTSDALGYDVSGSHLALVAWGPRGGAAARAVARATGRRLLIVGVFEDTAWGWLGGAPLSATALRQLAGFVPPEEAGLAFGDEGHGPDGFRTSHRQAVSAQRAGQLSGRAVTHYDDVALEALAAADVEEGRAFVARELRGLAGDDVRSGKLRDTLRAYFAAGQNAAATAAALGIHEQTVAQRVRAAEERTGRPVATRRAELETALRLREYLG